MRVRVDANNKWIMKEGEEVPVIMMADSHLVCAIHLMERNRVDRLKELERRVQEAEEAGIVVFPDGDVIMADNEEIESARDQYEQLRESYKRPTHRYYSLVAEAIHRGLICRGPCEVERVVGIEEKQIVKIVYRDKPKGRKNGKGKKVSRRKS
jgi:hypothetical protein